MEIKSIQNISDSYLCSACGACFSVCPKNAIYYSKTSIGRKYAVVNDNCIDCGICQKACPSINFETLSEKYEDKFIGSVIDTYVGRAVDVDIYKNAQSGGACTAILKYLFESNLIDAAIVCKMDFGNTPHVYPAIITNVSELYSTQKSNYTQVELLTIIKEIENYKSVAVVGLPCHIEAIRSIQQNLKVCLNLKYLLGIICDRSLCSTLQDVYKTYANDFKQIKIGWRAKFIPGTSPNCYTTAPITIYNNKGEYLKLSNIYRFSLKEMFTPPKCRTCVDKLNILADITLGDPWKMSGVDKENGDSLVMTRTESGQEIIKQCLEHGYLSLKNASLSEVINGQNIQQRRVSTAKFTEALNLFQGNGSILKQRDVKSEYTIIKTFINDEKKDMAQIIKKARFIIKKARFVSNLKAIKVKIISLLKK